MGSVIGTCGHQIYWKNDGAGFGNLFFIKESSDEGKRVTSVCVCDKCARWYRRKGRSFKSHEEAMEWLKEGGK